MLNIKHPCEGLETEIHSVKSSFMITLFSKLASEGYR
jgi:hypothetical protein